MPRQEHLPHGNEQAGPGAGAPLRRRHGRRGRRRVDRLQRLVRQAGRVSRQGGEEGWKGHPAVTARVLLFFFARVHACMREGGMEKVKCGPFIGSFLGEIRLPTE